MDHALYLLFYYSLLLWPLCPAHDAAGNGDAGRPEHLNGGKPVDKDALRQRRLAEVEKQIDADGWATVQALHSKMDDDHSGGVDISEAEGFVRDELDIKEKERVGRRQRQWSDDNDRMLTVDEMWFKWFTSEERSWTVDQAIDWLVTYIELPEYAEIFRKKNVEGADFAKMASPEGKFLVSLGILNPVHRHKLQLKAMDIILFGFRHPHPFYWLELSGAVVSTLIFAAAVFYRWKVVSEREQLLKFEEQLKQLEQLRETHKEELANARESTTASDGSPQDAEQLALLQHRLAEAERLLASNASAGVPVELLQLLYETRDAEMRRLHAQHKQNLDELRDTMEHVQRRQETSGSWANVSKYIVGHNTAAEQLDNRIEKIRLRMEQTKKEDVEAKRRWAKIFSLCVPQTSSPANGLLSMSAGSQQTGVRGVSHSQTSCTPLCQADWTGGAAAQQQQLNYSVAAGLTHLPYMVTSALAQVPACHNQRYMHMFGLGPVHEGTPAATGEQSYGWNVHANESWEGGRLSVSVDDASENSFDWDRREEDTFADLVDFARAAVARPSILSPTARLNCNGNSTTIAHSRSSVLLSSPQHAGSLDSNEARPAFHLGVTGLASDKRSPSPYGITPAATDSNGNAAARRSDSHEDSLDSSRKLPKIIHPQFVIDSQPSPTTSGETASLSSGSGSQVNKSTARLKGLFKKK